jgi:hypothetical protein
MVQIDRESGTLHPTRFVQEQSAVGKEVLPLYYVDPTATVIDLRK